MKVFSAPALAWIDQAAAGALGGVDVAGLLLQGNSQISLLTGYLLQFGEGMQLKVEVPADRDQLRGDNSPGAVVGGNDLRHGAAAAGARFTFQANPILG